MTRFRFVSMLMWVSLAALMPACGGGGQPPTAGSDRSPATPASPSASVVDGGDPATWSLAPDQTPQKSSTRFTAHVSRLGCNNGVTGQVLAPEIRMGESEIVVTFTVLPKQLGPARCPGNKIVPYEVDLGEPLQGRALVDGQCLPGGQAVTTSFCQPDGTRLRP